MTKKNTCDKPWLVCWASIINPKNLGLRLGCYSINKKKKTHNNQELGTQLVLNVFPIDLGSGVYGLGWEVFSIWPIMFRLKRIQSTGIDWVGPMGWTGFFLIEH